MDIDDFKFEGLSSLSSFTDWIEDKELYIQIKNFDSDNILELLINKNESEIFSIIKYFVVDFDKFKILFNAFFSQIDLMQSDYYLFKLAVLKGSEKSVKFLLQNGCNTPELLDFALAIVVNCQVESRYNVKGNHMNSIKILKYLLNYNVDVTKNNNYAICATAKNYSDLVIFKLLENNGADITARFNYPIRIAAVKRNINLVCHLIESGVDFRTHNDYVFKQLCINPHFVNNENYPVIEFLLKSGADANSFTKLELISLMKFSSIELITLLLENNLQPSNLTPHDIISNFDTISESDSKNRIVKKYNLLVDNYDMNPLVFALLKIG